jgi:hypothetical protein
MKRSIKSLMTAGCLLLAIVSTASAQTVYRGPAGMTGGLSVPGVGGTAAGTGLSGSPTLTTPGLSGTLPATAAPQVIQQSPVVVAPPRAPVAAAPDGGDTTECDCYRTDMIPIASASGQVTWRTQRVRTGQKSSACCPR